MGRVSAVQAPDAQRAVHYKKVQHHEGAYAGVLARAAAALRAGQVGAVLAKNGKGGGTRAAQGDRG